MHIVVFTGGKAPEPSVTEKYFLSHVSKPDAVIAADSGLETLLTYAEYFKDRIDFTPDYICGDMDSIKDKSLPEKFESAKKEIFPEYKDFTDTELALKKAFSLFADKKTSADTVTLVGGDAGRLDHLLGVIETFSSAEHADFWICCEQIVCFVKDGTTAKISCLNEKDPVSIYKVNEKQNASFESKGLEWGEEVFRKTKMPSLSNRISSEYLVNKKPVEITPCNTDCLLFVPYTACLTTFLPQEK